MEQMFQRHFCVFFLEFKQFSFYIGKAVTSFARLSFDLLRIGLLLIRTLAHLFLVGPTLVTRHSPTDVKPVERNLYVQFPIKF